MKIAVSSYSYMGALRDGRMNIMDVIPTAKDTGFEGIEIANVDPLGDVIRAQADALRAQSESLDMPIAAYLTSGNFLAEDLNAEVDKMCREAELAKQLGAPRMRHDACWAVAEGTLFEDKLPILIEGYRRVTEYAASLGIATMIENHGFFTQDSDRVERIVKGVGHPNFGWLVDIGNFLCADEEPEHALAIAAPYAVHAHAKDFHRKSSAEFAPETGWFGTRGGNHLRGAMLGHGNMDVRGLLNMLTEAGYDGWLSMEFEGVEDCLMAVPEGLKNLRAILSE